MPPEIDQTVFSWSNFLLQLFRRQAPNNFSACSTLDFHPRSAESMSDFSVVILHLPSIWTRCSLSHAVILATVSFISDRPKKTRLALLAIHCLRSSKAPQ